MAGSALDPWGPGRVSSVTCRYRQWGPSGVWRPAGGLPWFLGGRGTDHPLGASHGAGPGWEAWAGEQAKGLDLLQVVGE